MTSIPGQGEALASDQAEPGLPAILGALRPADRVFAVSRIRDTGCPHTCGCTSDMECPHECTCQEDQQ